MSVNAITLKNCLNAVNCLLIFLVFNACSSSVNQEKLSKDDFQKITIPNLLEIQIPKYMQRSGTNRAAKVEYIDTAKKIMVLVMSEKKDTIVSQLLNDRTIKDKSELLSRFSEIYVQTILYQLKDAQLGEFSSLKINSYPSLQNEITGTHPGNNYKAKMKITFIEGENNLYIISTIGDLATFSTYENTFSQIVQSFKEL